MPLPASSSAPVFLQRPEAERWIGPFRLVRQLGRGGFAPVWLAEEIYDGRKLRDAAVKLFFLPDGLAPGSREAAGWRDAILDEARALCRVEHPNVVRFYALHRDDAWGVVGLAMEHVAGESLDRRLEQAGRLDPREAAEAALGVAWALSAVHAAGLVHHDVKPGNIVERAPDPGEASGRGPAARAYKLIDFGIVVDDPSRSSAGSAGDRPLFGSRGYMAPELLLGGPASPGTDLYALGATLFRLCTGQLPVDAMGGIEALLARKHPPRLDALLPPDKPEIEPLARLTALLLDPDPGARPRHAEWVARELERALGVSLRDSLPEAPRDRLPATARDRLPEAPRDRLPATARERLPEAPRERLPEAPRDRLPATVRAERGYPDADLARRDVTTAPDADHAGDQRPAAVPPCAIPSPASPTETVDPPEPRPHAPLVGRGDALAAVARLAAEARDGGVRAALITGPLGIGRTRLLAAAIDRVGAAEGRVLRAACSPERKSPLRPLLRALEALAPEDAGALGLLQDAIERALSPSVLPGAPDAAAALEGVEDALLWASAEARLVLAIDDLQWADAHTLALLRLLIERVGAGAAPGQGASSSHGAAPSYGAASRHGAGPRLLVLATARDEPSPPPPLRALLGELRGRTRPGARHLALGPLGDDDAARLAQATLPVAPALERAVVRGAGGVPFFIVHALVAWRETGALVYRKGAWDAAAPDLLDRGVPGVADLVTARLAGYLDPGSDAGRLALRALAAAALYGGGLGADVLAEVVGGDDDDEALEVALVALVDAGILVASKGGQEYGFAQEMVRQAVLNLVRPRPWLRRLHRALLDTVARGPQAAADAAFLAAGYERLGAAAEARRWLRRATEAAVSAGLFAEAVELGDRLAALAEDPDERAAAEIEAVRALLRGRKLEEARRRIDALDARAAVFPAASPAVSLRRRICRLEVARGMREEGYDDPVLLADADAQPDLALRCEARMALAGVAASERAVALAGEAVALAARAGPALEFGARVLRFELNYASNRRDLDVAEEDLTRALAIAAALGSSWHRLHIEADLAVLEAERGRLAAAIDRLGRIAAQAEADGMRGQLRLVLTNLAAFLLRAGRAAEAAATAGRTAELAAEAGDPALRASALSLRADALRRVGDLDGALAAADEAEALQRAHGDRRRALTLLRRAEILALAGRFERAFADARAAGELAGARGDRNLAIAARLWELLQRARRGEIGAEVLEEAIAEASGSGVTLRPLTLGLLADARAWVTSSASASASGSSSAPVSGPSSAPASG
ncbi:serine/threonine-protein kinase [Sorangium sp. So ce131]|uniref:serine/threonine-protein kinase n=1 Tax=Sorangium sp. So ce131 TaxID=3133282 RepID=UPI003F61B477